MRLAGHQCSIGFRLQPSRERDYTCVRGSGSVYPSPPCSRGSAQGFLDVSNLCRSGTEEEDEEDALRVPCMA